MTLLTLLVLAAVDVAADESEHISTCEDNLVIVVLAPRSTIDTSTGKAD